MFLFHVCSCLFLSDAEGRGNPLVSGFQDDLDPDDRVLCQPAVKAAVPSMGVTLTSDEEEDGSSLPSAFQNKDIILNTKGSDAAVKPSCFKKKDQTC